MFTDKSLCEEVRSLRGKLYDLEGHGYGQKIEELQRANRELEQEQRGTTEQLQRESHNLAVRLGVLQGMASVLLAVAGGVAVYYVDRYHTEVTQVRQTNTVQAEGYEVLVDQLQVKFGDTLDRISLFAPTGEDKVMVTELDEMRQRLGRLNVASERFDSLSELINALKLIVNEGKGKEASAQLDKKALTVSKDRFVASRALVLQAITLIQTSQLCKDPEGIKALISGAIQRDSGVAAAFNLMGVCLVEESKTLMSKQPERWRASGELMQAALRNNELAYQLKPTPWSRARLLNNRVWGISEFLMAALAQGRLNESLGWTGYASMDELLEQSIKDLEECQMLEQEQPAYLETLTELHGLECAFYRSPSHKDERKAEEALEKMIKALTGAINKGLLRKMSETNEAERYFSEDSLLAPLFANPANPHTLDSRIKALIEQRVRPH